MEKKILIVDDSESIREVVSFTLENAGHEVVKAVDGQDALKYLDGQKYDLIITDLHMPNLNGIELIKKVRTIEEYKFIPILFLTTESQTAKKWKLEMPGLQAGLSNHLFPRNCSRQLKKL